MSAETAAREMLPASPVLGRGAQPSGAEDRDSSSVTLLGMTGVAVSSIRVVRGLRLTA